MFGPGGDGLSEVGHAGEHAAAKPAIGENEQRIKTRSRHPSKPPPEETRPTGIVYCSQTGALGRKLKAQMEREPSPHAQNARSRSHVWCLSGRITGLVPATRMRTSGSYWSSKLHATVASAGWSPRETPVTHAPNHPASPHAAGLDIVPQTRIVSQTTLTGYPDGCERSSNEAVGKMLTARNAKKSCVSRDRHGISASRCRQSAN